MQLDRNFAKADHSELIENIIRFYKNNMADRVFPDWYNYAFDDCSYISELGLIMYGVKTEVWQVAAIVAILSPANKWATNKQDALNVISEIADDQKDIAYFTYGNNVAKAREMTKYDLDKDSQFICEKYLKTPKILNFFWSILDSQAAFCVDRHMLTVAGINSGKEFPTKAQYNAIQKVFLTVWEKLNKPFGSPAKFQAQLWQATVFTKNGINHY